MRRGLILLDNRVRVVTAQVLIEIVKVPVDVVVISNYWKDPLEPILIKILIKVYDLVAEDFIINSRRFISSLLFVIGRGATNFGFIKGSLVILAVNYYYFDKKVRTVY